MVVNICQFQNLSTSDNICAPDMFATASHAFTDFYFFSFAVLSACFFYFKELYSCYSFFYNSI